MSAFNASQLGIVPSWSFSRDPHINPHINPWVNLAPGMMSQIDVQPFLPTPMGPVPGSVPYGASIGVGEFAPVVPNGGSIGAPPGVRIGPVAGVQQPMSNQLGCGLRPGPQSAGVSGLRGDLGYIVQPNAMVPGHGLPITPYAPYNRPPTPVPEDSIALWQTRYGRGLGLPIVDSWYWRHRKAITIGAVAGLAVLGFVTVTSFLR